eukprot:m.183760 g.183760  ORF g.183760 m.183760 type:complete len:465 (+) comp18487_c0_seq4:111-1505(+)
MKHFQAEKRRFAVCIVSDYFYPNVGGVENHIFAVAACLALRGHKVVIVSHHYESHRQRKESMQRCTPPLASCYKGVSWLEPGIKVYHLPLPVIYAVQSVLPSVVGGVPLLRSIFLREGIEVVHGHQQASSLSMEALALASTLGLPTVYTDHSLFGFDNIGVIVSNKLLKFSISTISQVICVSNTSRENLVIRGMVPPELVNVIPNAIDANQFQPNISVRNAEPENRINIIVISRLVYRKGVDILIRLIPLLCLGDSRVHFIIGGDGVRRVEVDEICEKHALQGRVEMLGSVPPRDVASVLQRGDIFLNCSLTESFCIANVEAASTGLIVVSTRVGGVPEVLPNEMLILADPTVSGLAGAVNLAKERLPRHPSKQEEQHNSVKDMYNWHDVAVRTEDVYARACAQFPRCNIATRITRSWDIGVIAGPFTVCLAVLIEMAVIIASWFAPVHEIGEGMWPAAWQGQN